MEETVRFYSGPGYGLAGVISTPDGPREPEGHPGIILCQGYAGLKEALMPAVAARLSAEGYVTLRFDYRGFGESEGPRHRLIPLEQIEDIRNGLTCLGVRDEVDPERLAVWGTSFGGAHATYAAAVDERVRCIVSVVGVGDGERWLRCLRREWEWQAFLQELDEDRDRAGPDRPVPARAPLPHHGDDAGRMGVLERDRGRQPRTGPGRDAPGVRRRHHGVQARDRGAGDGMSRPVRVRRTGHPDPAGRADQSSTRNHRSPGTMRSCRASTITTSTRSPT